MLDETEAKPALKQWREWKNQLLEDPDLTQELELIKNNTNELTDRFYKSLTFGTGGLRGVIGAGTNRMNIYTVAKATKGYSDYLNKNFTSPSVAIAYDSRIKSDLFAKTAAEVFAANHIKVYLFRELAPTPALSFAVRYLNCSGGIVITASHNPSSYNGYKVYGKDGGQITSQAAAEILKSIEQIDIFKDTKRADFNASLEDKQITYISPDVITAYIEAVSEELQSLSEVPIKSPGQSNENLSITYTPLNGTGLYYVIRVLKENGFTNIQTVKEQEQPDGNFPTCPYPNPEIKEALELGLQYAKRNGSDLVLATDPDCDRIGAAVKSEKEYILLSGNEMGMLLFDFICKRRIALKTMPERPILVKTIVTTDMVKQIAADYGVEIIEVLTGFKFIGEQIGLLEKAGETGRYILGFEESYGYLSGSYVRDKDGVNAALLICEMCAYYKNQGQNLLMVLNGLYEKYGYSLNTLHSYTFEGPEGVQKMTKIMEHLRASNIASLAGKKLLSISDYKESLTRLGDGQIHPIHLPKSNVLKFSLEGNFSVVVRPSGTEPKLKLYLSASGENKKHAQNIEKLLLQEIEQFFCLQS